MNCKGLLTGYFLFTHFSVFTHPGPDFCERRSFPHEDKWTKVQDCWIFITENVNYSGTEVARILGV
jgi:hypothetical protein